MRVTARFLGAHAMSREARERRRQLERDIECFVTPAERQDLLAALGRYPDSKTADVREMVDHELAREQFERRFGHAHLRGVSVSQ